MLAEPGDVGRVDDLRVLDPPAPIPAIGCAHFLDGGEQGHVGFVANCVGGDLELVERGAAHQVFQLRIAGDAQALGARRIGIGRFQAGPTRTERAVEVKLHPVQAQAVLIKPGRRAGAADQAHGIGPGGIGHDPDAQRAGVSRAAIGLPILYAGAHVGNRSDALGQQQVLCLGQGQVAVLGTGGRDLAVDQLGRRVDQHACGLAAHGQPLDLAACRIARCRGDASGSERLGIGPTRMAIDAGQPDRAVTDNRVQFGSSRKALFRPQFLVPAAPQDPRAVRVSLGIGGNFGQRLGQRAGVGQVQRQRAKAQAHDVAVAVDHAGDQELSLAVQLVGRAFRALVAAVEHLLDPAIVGQDQAGKAINPALRIDGHPVDIVDQRIGQGRGGKRQRAGRAQQQSLHALPLRGRRRTRAEVSCRPPPSACTSA